MLLTAPDHIRPWKAPVPTKVDAWDGGYTLLTCLPGAPRAQHWRPNCSTSPRAICLAAAFWCHVPPPVAVHHQSTPSVCGKRRKWWRSWKPNWSKVWRGTVLPHPFPLLHCATHLTSSLGEDPRRGGGGEGQGGGEGGVNHIRIVMIQSGERMGCPYTVWYIYVVQGGGGGCFTEDWDTRKFAKNGQVCHQFCNRL